MKKKLLAAMMAAGMVFSVAGCGGGSDSSNADADGSGDTQAADAGSEEEETEIQVFIAASLNTVMTELADKYNEKHPNVKILLIRTARGLC